MTLRIGIFGRGRLGSLVDAAVRGASDLELLWAVGRGAGDGAGGLTQRSGTASGEDLGPVDVAVDVSHADAVPAHLDWARRTGTDLVIGTTGWDGALLAPLRAGSPGIGVLVAPNFSLSVALVRRLATVLGGYAVQAPEPVDLAVSETHHRAKVDAPSGTGASLREALASSSGRAAEEVATTSLRLGAVVGRHTVHYESASESMTLTHEAHTREVFAAGALAAARWVHRRPGIHDLDDWAGEHLDHLFRARATAPARS